MITQTRNFLQAYIQSHIFLLVSCSLLLCMVAMYKVFSQSTATVLWSSLVSIDDDKTSFNNGPKVVKMPNQFGPSLKDKEQATQLRNMKMRQNAYKTNGHSISDTTEQRPKVSWDTVTVYDQSSVKKQKLRTSLDLSKPHLTCEPRSVDLTVIDKSRRECSSCSEINKNSCSQNFLRTGTNSSLYYKKDKSILPTVAELQESKSNQNECESSSSVQSPNEDSETDFNSNMYTNTNKQQKKSSFNKTTLEVKSLATKENAVSKKSLVESNKNSHPNLFEGMSSIVAATTASVVGDQKNVVQEQKKYKEQLMEYDEEKLQELVQAILLEMGEERLIQYKEAFAKFDQDSAGIISSKQLRHLLRTLGHNPKDGELRELVNQVDVDENGKIDFNEFIIMIGYFDKANNEAEDLCDIFQVFDQQNKGFITVDELKNIWEEFLQSFITDKEFQEMMADIDEDGNGELDQLELLEILQSTR